MSDMKCPFCQSEIAFWGMDMFYCPHCANTKFCRGNKELWQELIHTRKALDIAINVLNRVKDVKYEEYIDEKLEQINEIIKGGENE